VQNLKQEKITLDKEKTTMKMVTESALKDRMCDYFREVEATGEELMVTKDGQLILKIISYNRYFGESESNHECASGQVHHH